MKCQYRRQSDDGADGDDGGALHWRRYSRKGMVDSILRR